VVGELWRFHRITHASLSQVSSAGSDYLSAIRAWPLYLGV